MDIVSFFTQAAAPISDAAARVVPQKHVQRAGDGPDKSKSAKAKPPSRTSTKAIKATPGKPRSVKIQNNSPAKSKPTGPLVDIDDVELGAENDVKNDVDEIPDEDSQWGEDEDGHQQQDSECGGDDDVGLDAGLDEDLDEDLGTGTYDMADLDISHSRLGAWKRRDKSTLPRPDLVGQPLTPDDDSHIT